LNVELPFDHGLRLSLCLTVFSLARAAGAGQTLRPRVLWGEKAMIGYATLGSNDFEKAKAFYDAVLAELGGKRTMTNDRMQGYGSGGGAMLAICKPYDGQRATGGNGTMVALAASSREVVDKAHAAAMANGATDEGAPGLRGDTFYGAYFRDLDGNKLCVFKIG
jgi:predicted lactoylglutathione lyase